MIAMPQIDSKKVRELREARAWSQEQLAKAAALSVRTVQRVEMGEACSAETLQALAATFNLDPADLRPKASSATTAPKTLPVAILKRMRSGKEICDVVGGAHMFQHDYAQPDSADAVEHVAAFLQELQDVGDIWEDIEAGERVRTAYAVGESLASLEERGWVVYAARVPRRFRFGERGPMQLDVAMVVVALPDNPRVTARGTDAEALPVTWSA